MKIGELAKRAGCKVETVRFYEREGLLPQPERSSGNFRVYTAEDVARLVFIRNCRSLGMALPEIRVLLDCRSEPNTDCRGVLALLDLQIRRVAHQVDALRRLERQLRGIRQMCNDRQNPEHRASACGIIRILDEPTHRLGQRPGRDGDRGGTASS
ncbi:MAG: Cd(II)/Pb(II)-responsive transcriptional regulator [Proteobacteria bacterium]|nr:Cd(II)/Pb(II)-responsive transcriptional regulator [Pseudomonadota bacterium]